MNKPFICEHCKLELGTRDGDSLIVGEVTIYVPKSADITCYGCKGQTRFYVRRDREPKKFDLLQGQTGGK